MSEYQLINPYVEGSFNRSFKGKDVLDVANKVWEGISENITNNVPKFAFTLEKTSDKKLFHFIIKEIVTDGNIDFSIEQLKLPNTQKSNKHLKAEVKKLLDRRNSQAGGKKKDKDKDKDDDDDSSSSSSDEDIFNRVMQPSYINHGYPFTYWWYSPTIYELDRVYVPTFVSPLMPYVELSTSYYIIP